MGRVTEIIHYLNCERAPTREWMRQHYTRFVPTYEDEKSRERFKKGKRPAKGRLRMKPIFDT